MTESKKPQLADYAKNAARAVIASDMGLAALQFAIDRIDRGRGGARERERIASAIDVVYSALYQEHRYRVHTLLRMLLANDDIDQAKALAWDEYKGGHVSHLGMPELAEAGICNAAEEEELLAALQKALLRGGV